MRRKYLYYIVLIIAFFIYASSTIFTKKASTYEFLSVPYYLFLAGAISILGLYALVWQQIIKRIPIGEAFMFKGTALFFVLLLSHLLFGEPISNNNIIGFVLIVAGIVIFARS